MTCPTCDEPQIGPFCEKCGYSYSCHATEQAATPSWYAIIAPDRNYFEARGTDADKFTFPASSTPWRVELTGASVVIGRRSTSRGITPGIDLAGPPVDPGVSREHARLLALPDGSWALVDEGSTNGTYLNGGTEPIRAHQQIPLVAGDRVHLGVWTTITVQRDS